LIKEAGNDPIKKAQLINEIVDTISIIPEEIIRLVYVKECSRILNVDERALLKAIAKKRKEIAEKKPSPVNAPVQEPVNQDSPASETTDDSVAASLSTVFSLDEFEQNLLRYIVKYGEQVLYKIEDEETQEKTPVTVVEYIHHELVQDELSFENPLFQQILEETLSQYQQEGFVAERYFLNHPNPEISQLAVKFVSDKYTLSKVHSKFQKIEEESERLIELVPYEVLNYKDAILKQQMDVLNARIKSAQDNNDFEAMTNLMSELSSLWQEPKKIISKHLGERIVIKI